MALELNKVTLAGIGVAARLGEEVEKLVNKIQNKEVEVEEVEAVEEEAEKKGLREQFEDFVEIGEEKYDELLERGKKEREEFEEKIKERVNKLFGSLGLVTREELEEIDSKIAKLQKVAKKAASAAKN